jgi:hypothetical protein
MGHGCKLVMYVTMLVVMKIYENAGAFGVVRVEDQPSFQSVQRSVHWPTDPFGLAGGLRALSLACAHRTAAGSKQQAASSRQQAAGSRQQAAGSRQQAAGCRQQACAQV